MNLEMNTGRTDAAESRKNPLASLLKVVTFLLTLVFLTVVPFLLWASARGFDITDEGFYLLGARYPSEITMWPDSAHRYEAVLFALVGHNVVALRWLGIALQLVFATILFHGLRRALETTDGRFRQPFPGSALMLSFVILGAMLYYHWLLATPSYNLFNALAVNGTGGLVVLSLVGTDHGLTNRRAHLAAFGAGLCLGLSFFVKSPTGLALFVLSAGVVATWPGTGYAGKKSRIGAIALGFACWLLCHFLFIEGPSAWWSTFGGGLTLVTALGAGHDAGQLASFRQQSWSFLKDSVNVFWRTYAAITAGAVLVFAIPAFRRQKPRIFAIVAGLAPAVLVWDASRFGWDYVAWRERTSGIFLFYAGTFLLAAILSALALLFRPTPPADAPARRFTGLWVLASFLGALPFAAALGTSNPIAVNLILNMGPWFGLLWVLFSLTLLRLGRPPVPVIAVAAVGGFALVQILSGVLNHPYRLHGGILRQVTPTRLGSPGTQVRLDPQTSEFFNEMRSLADASGLRPGDDVLALYSMPGVVFALGAKSPGIPWYTAGYPGSGAFNELALAQVPRPRLQRAFILENDSTGDAARDLARVGLHFPTAYELCGDATWPLTKTQVRLWKPATRGECGHLDTPAKSMPAALP